MGWWAERGVNKGVQSWEHGRGTPKINSAHSSFGGSGPVLPRMPLFPDTVGSCALGPSSAWHNGCCPRSPQYELNFCKLDHSTQQRVIELQHILLSRQYAYTQILNSQVYNPIRETHSTWMTMTGDTVPGEKEKMLSLQGYHEMRWKPKPFEMLWGWQ